MIPIERKCAMCGTDPQSPRKTSKGRILTEVHATRLRETGDVVLRDVARCKRGGKRGTASVARKCNQ
jgi:hypothetical protein